MHEFTVFIDAARLLDIGAQLDDAVRKEGRLLEQWEKWIGKNTKGDIYSTEQLGQRFDTSTSIYWRSCGPKAEQLDKTWKGLKTCKQHNKPKPKWREGSNPVAVTWWNLVIFKA